MENKSKIRGKGEITNTKDDITNPNQSIPKKATAQRTMGEKTYKIKAEEAKRVVMESFLSEFLYTKDDNGDRVDNLTITDISFNGTHMYVQDNEWGRYLVDSPRDPRILKGYAPLGITEKQVEDLGRKVANTMGDAWTNTDPILDSELGDLRTNFMNKEVSPFGVTFALRVSRPRLAITDISTLCDEDTAKLLEVFMRSDFNLLISGQTGSGKALTNDSLIPTPNGFVEMGKLTVGQTVFDRKGQPTKILGVYPQGKLPVYALELSDGRLVKCNDEHIWTVVDEDGAFKNYTVRELLNLKSQDEYVEFYIPTNELVEYSEKEFKESPYDFGNSLKGLGEQDLIPEEYLLGSSKQRLDLLKGIFDSYGELTDTGDIQFSSEDFNNLQSILSILDSLGEFGRIVEDSGRYLLTIEGTELIYNHFFKDKESVRERRTKVSFEIVEHDMVSEMTCIMVDNEEHLFLANDYVVTHNTELQKSLIGYIPENKKISLMEDTLDSHIKSIYPDKDINSWATSGEIKADNYIGFPKLIRAGLRNNPDWLMISEVRGEEALDLLSAALTGHSIMTTLHATGADNIPSRLSNMVTMNPNAPTYEALQLDIVSVLNLGMHLERIDDPETGRISRVVREIHEYTAFQPSVGIITQPIYERISHFDEETETYETKIIKHRLSDKMIKKIQDKQQIHLVPKVYKSGD